MELFVILILVHIVTDLLLRPPNIRYPAEIYGYLLFHGGTFFVIGFVLVLYNMGRPGVIAVAFAAVSHMLIDLYKKKVLRKKLTDGLIINVLDQILHLVSLIIAAFIVYPLVLASF
jgi:hypothetical protein